MHTSGSTECRASGMGTIIQDDAWHHIALVRNSTEVGPCSSFALWIDGVQRDIGADAESATGTPNIETYYFASQGGAAHADFSLDEALYFHRGLIPADILTLNHSNYTNSSGEGPAVTDPINLTLSNPTDGLVIRTQLLNLNVTVNASGTYNLTLYVNGTINQTLTDQTAGNNIINSFNLTFGGTTEASYNYLWSADVNGTQENTTQATFHIDNLLPSFVTNLINGTVYSTRQHLQVNFTDVNLYEANISSTCFPSSYSNTSISTPHLYDELFNTTSCELGLQQTNISVCDGSGTHLSCIFETYNWVAGARINVTAVSALNGSAALEFDVYLNGTLDGSTTVGYYHLDGLTDLSNYTIKVVPGGLAESNQSFFVNGQAYNLLEFTSYTRQSFNFTFRDEQNLSILYGPSTEEITVEFISDGQSYNYSANGTLYVDLLVPSDYIIRYSKPGYGRLRQFFYRLENNSHQEIDLYLLHDSVSTDLTVTVFDETTLNRKENAVVYLQRYYPTTNSYETVAMYGTDVAGNSYFDVEQQNEQYKFLVEFPWQTLRLTSQPLYVEASTINLYINTQEAIGKTFYDSALGVTYDITYLNNSREFQATFVDSANTVGEFCFYVKQNSLYTKTTINSSCTSASSGTITLGGLNDNTTYFASLIGTTGSNEYFIGSGWIDIPDSTLNAGAYGVFLAAIIFMVFAFISSFSIYASILATSSLVFSKMLGLLGGLSWGYISLVITSSILLALVMEMKR